MKQVLFTFLCLFLLADTSIGQISTPAASPFSTVEQAVGLVDVTVAYSRPGKKGRALFGPGNLVEYGKLYRTGANGVTKITFSDDVTLNDKELPKGTYALLSTPGADMWKLHFYSYEARSWSSYVEKTPTLTISSKPSMMKSEMETFTIHFSNFTNDSAEMGIAWGKVNVPVKISVATDEAVMASIDKVMAGPSNNDYYNAAAYFHTSGKDLKQALTWIQKATNVDEPKFWQVRREALILADLGMNKEAIAAAKKSKDLAMKAGNDDYVKMNEDSIKEWMK